jgi:hypothetical protein
VFVSPKPFGEHRVRLRPRRLAGGIGVSRYVQRALMKP